MAKKKSGKRKYSPSASKDVASAMRRHSISKGTGMKVCEGSGKGG